MYLREIIFVKQCMTLLLSEIWKHNGVKAVSLYIYRFKSEFNTSETQNEFQEIFSYVSQSLHLENVSRCPV